MECRRKLNDVDFTQVQSIRVVFYSNSHRIANVKRSRSLTRTLARNNEELDEEKEENQATTKRNEHTESTKSDISKQTDDKTPNRNCGV